MRHPAEHRVVVTGAGAITPVGQSVEEFWDALIAGRSGVRVVTRYATETLPVPFAGEIADFDVRAYLPNKVARRLDRYAQFGVAAALQAVEQAKIDPTPERTAVLVGSGYGPGQQMREQMRAFEEHGRRKMSPYFAATGSMDSAAGEIAVRIGARGACEAVVTACATGASSIGNAVRMIRHGYADVVVAGGTDDAVNPIDMAAAANAGALSLRDDDPSLVSRPFDRSRDGFVMGAGAGILVLESAGHAERRGAEILAEVAGYGATTDAYHATHPHPEGLAARQAMLDALADAGVRPEEVDHISAHGTGTALNDRIESAAIRAVFGAAAPRIPISAVKSATGHMIGAAGAVEAIAAIQAIRTGMVPPTLNCDDPEDPGLDYVPHRARAAEVRTVLSNSFGFGGHNAVIVVREWERNR